MPENPFQLPEYDVLRGTSQPPRKERDEAYWVETVEALATCEICETILTRDELVIPVTLRSSAGNEERELRLPMCPTCKQRVDDREEEAIVALSAVLERQVRE